MVNLRGRWRLVTPICGPEQRRCTKNHISIFPIVLYLFWKLWQYYTRISPCCMLANLCFQEIIERGQCESTQILNIWRAQERNYFITNKHRRWADDVMDVPGRFYIVLPVKGAFAQWKNQKVSFPSVGGVEVWGKLRCGGIAVRELRCWGVAVWGSCSIWGSQWLPNLGSLRFRRFPRFLHISQKTNYFKNSLRLNR